METKTERILLETYKKMYESMKNSADKKRIGKLIEELNLHKKEVIMTDTEKELPIDQRNGKPHKGTENLKSWKPGQSGNPKGRPNGALGAKGKLKRDLQVMKWMQEDPELAALVESLDNTEMFEALKNTAFAIYANDPTDMTKYDRAYKAVAEEREYSEGKKIRQEVDSRVTQVSEMTIEELEAELAGVTDIDPEDLDPPGVNAQVEGSDFEKPKED
jgi:hypothetical protein